MRVFVALSRHPVDQLNFALPSVTAGAAPSSGGTPHFTVFCMPDLLPAGGNQVAASVLARCENDYTQLCNWFGINPPALHFNVTLAGLSHFLDGTGGAFHKSCDSPDIYCDVKLNPTIDAGVSSALLVAEAVETFSAIQDKGWNCGWTNGEGLSRVLACASYPNVLPAGYVTSYLWLDGNRLNFVDVNHRTDRNGESNGCAVLFLNWMCYQLGIGWDIITQAGGSTLAETYQRVTRRNDGWQRFSALMNRTYPPGQQSKLPTDNPFPL